MTDHLESAWKLFRLHMEQKCSPAEFTNWISPIQYQDSTADHMTVSVPNIFVQEYLLEHYKKELLHFFPTLASGEPAITFALALEEKKEKTPSLPTTPIRPQEELKQGSFRLNPLYLFDHFIEGPSNQFVKSAALAVAKHPAKSYNPLFIHGGVGLGKTHLLHAIGHEIKKYAPKLKIYCITTEGFINDLVDNLRNKTIDKMKRFYRSLDVLLVDDIQFLQNKTSFEEEFCNTFESLIHQSKQIVIASDKPPSHLHLSDRLVARMECGLVANIDAPDLETRVAILQYKAELKGIRLPQKLAFFIAEHIYHNVRQLEGAINRLSAYSKTMGLDITADTVEKSLQDIFHATPSHKVSIESILKTVSTIFDVTVTDLTGSSRSKNIALPRQVAMYMAKELLSDSLMKLASSFGGKTHSTLLHAWKKISGQLSKDEVLRKRVDLAKRNLEV